MSINTEMTALADAIRNKSGVTGKLSIAAMTSAVGNIVINPGETVDLSFVTATAGDILSGKVGADKNGNPVYGTLEVTGGSDIDLSGVTATADTMLEGVIAVGKSGETIVGNIKTVTPVVTETSVTIEPGYVAETLNFEIGGGGNDVDVPALATVTQYSPATPDFQLVTSVEVSGIEDLIWSDDPDSEDYEYNEYYSEANGIYNVTPETAGERDWRNRIYKHESKEYYLWYEYFEDSMEDSTWFIGETIGEGFLRKYNEWDPDTDEMLPVDDLESGTSEWGDYDFEPFSVTLDATTTLIPSSPMVLKGRKVTGHVGDDWVYSGEETDFAYIHAVPQIGFTYVAVSDRLIGGPVDFKLLDLSFNYDDSPLVDDSCYRHTVTQEGGELVSGGAVPDVDAHANAWNFNGGFLKIEPKGNEFVFGASDFTIEMYIYPTSDSRQCLFSYWDDGVFAICFSYDGDCRVGVFGGAHGWSNRNVSDPLELNMWHAITIARRGNSLRCIFDGKSLRDAVDMTGKIVGRQQAICFGRWGNDPGDFDARWQGYMTDIRIYNTAAY